VASFACEERMIDLPNFILQFLLDTAIEILNGSAVTQTWST
jgi:hypothetical protein